MTHPTQQHLTPLPPPRAGDPRDLPATPIDRPDLAGPRGNQDVETQDVERGEGKLDRILGW
jgi:hypothetical protein